MSRILIIKNPGIAVELSADTAGSNPPRDFMSTVEEQRLNSIKGLRCQAYQGQTKQAEALRPEEWPGLPRP